jgi:hypothetical protein
MDVRSSKRFYYNRCHVEYKRKYDNIIAADESLGTVQDTDLVEFVAFTAVKEYVDERSEDSFPLINLEQIYLQKLTELGKDVQSHTTRFVRKLKSADIGLTVIQKGERCNYTAVKTDRLKNIIPDSDWIHMLRNGIEPVRNEIIEVQQMEKPAMTDLSTDPWAPTYQKLKFLITFLCLGKPDVGNVDLPLDTISIYHIPADRL